MGLNEAVRQNIVFNKNSKKLQEHNVALKEREAHKVVQVEELLKQLEYLVEVEKVKEAKTESLKREPKKVKDDLKQLQGELMEAMVKVVIDT